MSTQAVARTSGDDRAGVPWTDAAFGDFGGLCALLAGASGFLYSVAFVILKRTTPALGDTLSALFLLLGGLFATAALLALRERLAAHAPAFATWALLLGLAAALGSCIHGGYDLANAINPPATVNADLPSQIDPRGLLTFGIAGIAVLTFAGLGRLGGVLPRGLTWLGYATGVLLIWIYLARLIILDATNPLVVVPALLAGFLANPAWYLWLGLTLRRPTP